MTLIQKIETAAIFAVLSGCGAVACSAALPPPSRALCYAEADQAAQRRVDAECSTPDAGAHFETCPTKGAILAELQKAQEACP